MIVAVIVCAALVPLVILVPWLMFVVTLALAKALAVIGVLLLLRAGQVSFGHALYIAAGAYAVAFAAPVVSDMLGLLLLGTAAATLVGIVVGLFVSRYRDIFFGMLNLAISMVGYSALDKFYGLTHGSDGIRIPPLTLVGMALEREQAEWTMFGLSLGLALGCTWLGQIYLRSPLGVGLSALKTRETRLEFVGISARLTLYWAYVFSAALGGLGGALIAMTTRHITPLLAYWTASGELVFIAILGGMSSMAGPLLGALTYEIVRVNAAALVVDAWQGVLGLVLLVVILFARDGIWGAINTFLPKRLRA